MLRQLDKSWAGINLFICLFALTILSGVAQGLTLTVSGSDGAPVEGFRWLVEQDATYGVTPGVPDPDTLAVRFHTSYMPVVATGESAGSSAVIDVPNDKRYFVSVLPKDGYSNSGASVAAGQDAVAVTCQSLPLPTAQISVFIFEDNSPINGQPDLPAERPLEGFKVTVVEAGGTYGASGGQMMMDIFGNMLGTTYDEDGNVVTMGSGVFTSDANGLVSIKNIAQGKYTIFITPPAGGGWHQTTTIEGTQGNDAWVKPGEPSFFAEFGPPGWHVFYGFVKETHDSEALNGQGTVSGQIVNMHNSRPPEYTFWPGEPVPQAWIGLNDMAAGGRAVYAGPCNMDATFEIPNVPAGTYDLVIWDEPLDVIIATKTIQTDGGDLELGQVPVFNWFGRMKNKVFFDANENGFPDPGERGIDNVPINLRFRDGSIYQSAVTDMMGEADFNEVFPFFNWLVAEVGYTRSKPTGATVVVDGGGPVLPDQGWAYPSYDVLTPQPQFEADGVTPLINPNTGNNLSRTETGPAVLLQGFQSFLGTTNAIEWGKNNWDKVDADNAPLGNFPGEEDVDQNGNGEYDSSNGGISGVVYYATTRAENDPQFAAAETWEPGIPRVQVNLYSDSNDDKVVDDLDQSGDVTLADVDNWPFGWMDGGTKGDEDIDRNDNGLFDVGDALNIVHTDSWDDSIPTGAQGPPFYHLGVPTDCYDGLRNFNQVRPAVFDGGYAFGGRYVRDEEGQVLTDENGFVETPGLPDGTYYIVEAATPPGYEHQKEEDQNVVFGETYTPVAGAKSGSLYQYPTPVGDVREVPAYLSLFPDLQEPCAHAGEMRPLPDRKQLYLTAKQNAPCDFHMFTQVPVAGHIVGMILNDLANEFDPNAPTFGEKQAPAWLPISIQDHTGTEISRVYCDQWGTYNALVPSTFSINAPFASGVSPKMLTVVLNSPGPILDTDPQSPTYNQYITDPYFNRQYSQFLYTFQYMPGKTTYLDTPVLPISAYTGPGQFPLDTAFSDGTPVIWSVQGGPYVSAPGQTITVASAGNVDVPNPLYTPEGDEPMLIARDYGFGTVKGTITVGGVALTNVTWTDGVITATVPAGAETGQLMIKRGDNGKSTVMGITLTVGPIDGEVIQVSPSAKTSSTPIQDAIDAANPGDLILIAPGRYNESVILWKPVQLQGWGAYSTIINAVKTPTEKLQEWRDKVQALVLDGHVDLLPGQSLNFGGIEPGTLNTEEGPAIFVMGRNTTPNNGGFGSQHRPRIDGLTLTGADHGGGIMVNGYAHYLQISNNHVTGNQGFYGGGIRIGHPLLTTETADGVAYEHGHNDHIKIHHNHIDQNGGLDGSGGGIALHTGTDAYEITDNHITGNFIAGNGGGIGHQGLSQGGLIARNEIRFNQSFDQGTNPSGGGIYIGGAAPLTANGLTPGSGSVRIDGNIIQGNQAGAGDGGGIRLESINGLDVENNAQNPGSWYTITVTNNVIANNMTGLAGGGISLQDAASVKIVNNTVVRNDSTATAGLAFAPGSPNESTPQPAGIVSRAHSPALAALTTGGDFSNPLLVNNIIWQNRSFHFVVNQGGNTPFSLVPDPASPVYADLAVLGTPAPAALTPMNCILTDTTGYHSSNKSNDPLFVSKYFNGSPGQTILMPEVTTGIEVAAAFDEGGNFIDIHFGPLSTTNPQTGAPLSNYHLQSASPARDKGDLTVLGTVAGATRDIDNDIRPNGGVDVGADEYQASNSTNSAPLAIDDHFTIQYSLFFAIGTVDNPGVLGNDRDPNGDTLRASLVQSARHGIVLLNSRGGFTYISLFYTGTDTFTYRVRDSHGTYSNVATVTLNVTSGGNKRPVATNDTYDTQVDTPLVIPIPGVLANDTDPNGDTISARLVSGRNVSHGALSFRSDGSFAYTPASGYVGADSFRYTAFDGSTSNQATVTINVGAAPTETNVAPAPAANAIDVVMDQAGVTRVVPRDPNFYDTHVYDITTAPAHGEATITATGIVHYMPAMGYMGADSLVVTVTDQGGLSAAVTVDITVTMAPMGGAYNGLIQRGGPDDQFVHLSAGDGFVRMADGKVMYCFGFGDLTNVPDEDAIMEGMLGAQFPGPTIVAQEGTPVYLNLTNVGMAMRPDLFDQHTVHWHGFPQAAPVFDGEPEGSISVNMGSTLTYYYEPVEPGTYMYHCHREAAEHMQMGMLGNLYVTPAQDGSEYVYGGKTYTKFAYNDGDGSTGYDKHYPLQLGSFDPRFHTASVEVQPLPFALMRDTYPMINGRGYPDTVDPNPPTPPDENGGKVSQPVSSLIEAQVGERILLRLSNLCVTRLYTLASTLPMEIVGQNARLLRSTGGENLYYTTNSVTLGGGESCDAIIDTTGVAPGTYLLYTTNLNYLSNDKEDFGGMMTEIVISE